MDRAELAPSDDPEISCEVRLWKGEKVLVFVFPKEWKEISITGGTPVIVTCNGVSFNCRVKNCGEHFRLGLPKSVKPSDFQLPTHGDYPATARIDWISAMPEAVMVELSHSRKLQVAWLKLSSAEMRARLSHIYRARTEHAIKSREVEVLKDLSLS